MGTFDLDLYKRLFFDRAELALGGGAGEWWARVRALRRHATRVSKAAASRCFSTATTTLMEFEKSEIGAVARARYSLLMGDWRDTTGGSIVPATDNDTMSITELAWGLEYRRRFGPCEDHSWFVGRARRVSALAKRLDVELHRNLDWCQRPQHLHRPQLVISAPAQHAAILTGSGVMPPAMVAASTTICRESVEFGTDLVSLGKTLRSAKTSRSR